MKKVLCIIISFVMVICTSAFAADVTIKDATKNIITLKGEANKGDVVTVAVLNPGYTVSDVALSGERALQYYGKVTADDNGYGIDIRMTDPYDFGGGTYTVICSTKGATDTNSFGFYFYEKKIDEIKKLNQNGSDGRVESIYQVYSLDSHELLSAVNENTIEKVLEAGGPYEEDADKMYAALVEALCVSAYRDGIDECVKDGYFTYTDVVGIDSESTYEDYLSSLNENGLKDVHKKVLGKEYKNSEEIREEFSKSVLLNLITNSPKMGFGHVPGVLEKYSEELSSFGFDTDKLKSVKNKNYVYKKLADSSAASIDALNETFEKAIKDADEKKETSSGGGGGGGGGGSSTTITAPSDKVEKPVVSGNNTSGGYVENTTVPFSDMTLAPWANDSVAYLYRRGIISGKGANLFDPSATVTREEFAKMAVLAFVGSAGGSVSSFADVSGWSAPYVAMAAAKGIVTGVSDTEFNPKGNVTREQAATIIARAMESAGFEFTKEAKEFDDKDSMSEWAKDKIGLLAAEEIISGRDGYTFFPKDNMTRAEAAKLIYEAMKRTGGTN